MIEPLAVVAPNAAAITVRIVAVEAAAAAWAGLAVVAAGVEVEVFEAVVAGANGTVGRFRSEGDFPDALAAGSMGRHK